MALCTVACAAVVEAEAVGDCLGVDFDVAHPIAVGKVVPGQPRVYFIRSAADNASCPADSEACRKAAYLIPGNLALIGKTDGAYTCISYESAASRKVQWTNGWIPSAAMTVVKPAPSPQRSDWIGIWVHASGHIDIAAGEKESLAIKGEGFYDAAQNVHTGVIDATATPKQQFLEFADDGKTPFDKASDDRGSCLVRMQRVEAFLVVEDNNACGGAMVTFTGFYRRKSQ